MRLKSRSLLVWSKMVGINQRDLRTFKVDRRALRVVSEIPEDIIRVAESGIRSLSDAEPLKPQDSMQFNR